MRNVVGLKEKLYICIDNFKRRTNFYKNIMMKHVTIKDIARSLCISVSTVSRALTDDKNIRKETREMVIEEAKRLGYKRNPVAMNLKMGRTNTIGVIVPEMHTPYASQVINGIQEVLYKKNQKVMIAESDEKPERELENLKIQPDLYRVVTLLVLNAVTQDLYLSDRSHSRLIIFDEAWQFLGKAAMLAPVVNEGYRRARKYNGSFMIITQSILDLDSFGEVGRVVNGNSAFKIYLESSDFDQARKQGLIDYDDFVLQLLRSVKSNPPQYSEIFFDTPFGLGVARLVVNDYDYFIYTSKPTEIAEIERMVQAGASYHEAILEMVARRADGAL